ncbi:bifunctional 4-hydroxy-2-oxoglutarate aldolase/2-dehydro-3-deoxy-phosphogluconate aldolase [Parafrigoribacterium mesophilum]|uniref:bifunctional 4-hydroxy-2-oxoglutarate aldolase/2-dehydro-3-deoxy-phosphogluconate aldolase n=1 Tax=Parafrigoribacterium mesophilum TaxID=433646 RepID=UPI0031FDA173
MIRDDTSLVAPADFLRSLTSARLLAIIRGSQADAAIATALALIDEGFQFLEISLGTDDALRVIETVAQRSGSAMVGAGTVLSVSDVTHARDAGSSFLVTPALAPSVAESVRRGVPVIAGAMTPTEAYSAMQVGATAVKLFPASSGGPAFLSALRDPLPTTPFVPVGGVDLPAAKEYWARGAVAVGIGSPLVKDAASGGDLDTLRERARAFLAAAAQAGEQAGSRSASRP